jgi:hypothetical protein
VSLDELVSIAPFSLRHTQKQAALLPALVELQELHRERCPAYARILDAIGERPGRGYRRIEDLPFLPVRLFKEHELRSVPATDVFKVLTSSGTTGQQASRIYLDREAAAMQAKALTRVLGQVLGPRRLPMLIVDGPGLLRDRSALSARGAGVAGMMNFGRHHTFALDENFRLDIDAMRRFLARFGHEPFLLFGFTFMVWRHLYEPARSAGLDLSNGVLVHSGGWKQLVDDAVSPTEFRARLRADIGLTDVYNFYGMVEQIGTIYLEAPDDAGVLYAPAFADVVLRDPVTWREVGPGETGIIEVVSLLPRSYPGHALLTDDIGELVGIDDGPTWSGKRFRVLGRVPRAEVRGCSDTYAPAT